MQEGVRQASMLEKVREQAARLSPTKGRNQSLAGTFDSLRKIEPQAYQTLKEETEVVFNQGETEAEESSHSNPHSLASSSTLWHLARRGSERRESATLSQVWFDEGIGGWAGQHAHDELEAQAEEGMNQRTAAPTRPAGVPPLAVDVERGANPNPDPSTLEGLSKGVAEGPHRSRVAGAVGAAPPEAPLKPIVSTGRLRAFRLAAVLALALFALVFFAPGPEAVGPPPPPPPAAAAAAWASDPRDRPPPAAPPKPPPPRDAAVGQGAAAKASTPARLAGKSRE